MALRAAPPELDQGRFKALIYGDAGSGKTHFVCSFPGVYYIDTEDVKKYRKYITMLKNNNSQIVSLIDFAEIIKEVKELMILKHDYKTLVIDSITFPYGLLSNLEIERLAKKDSRKEGTEYGANLVKPKALTFRLGMLLSALDMNVIVVAHQKSRIERGTEDTIKTYDINEKMAYALGTVMRIDRIGNVTNGFIEKSRYDELPQNQLINITDGYREFKQRFGEDIFVKNVATVKLASEAQIKQFNELFKELKLQDETRQKWLLKTHSACVEDMKEEDIQKCIDLMLRTKSKEIK